MRIFRYQKLCMFVFSVWGLLSGPALSVALIWRVDFNGSSADTLSTSNFSGWIVSSTSRTQVFANVDGGAINSNLAICLRGGGTWSTYERTVNSSSSTNLYRDGVQTTISGITVSLTNLTPSVTYGVRFWYFDNNFSIGTTQTYVNITGGSSTGMGALTNRGSAQLPTDLYDSRYSIYVEATADAGGNLDFSVTPSSGNTKVNALEVNALNVNISRSLIYSAVDFFESTANDGKVTNTLALTLVNDSFTGNDGDDLVAAGKVSVVNIPSGLTAVLSRVNSTQATLSLTGQAVAHTASDSINNLTVRFNDAAFASASASNITGYTHADISVTFMDPTLRTLTYSSLIFSESVADNGSIGNSLTISLVNEQLVGSHGDDFISLGRASVANVPVGLQAVLTRQDTTTLTFSLAGQATAHAASNNIGNLTVTFANSAFAGGDASGVIGYSRSDIGVNYNGSWVTNPSGPTNGVFLAWCSYPGATYRIEMSTNLLAPAQGGFVPVVTNIPATPAYSQHYVAPSQADTEFYRVIRE